MSHYVLLRYLSIALITRVLLCSAAIAGLLELLSLLEQTTLILQRHLGLRGVFYYAILRFPFLISNALPPGMLIGTLFMLTQMTFSSEIPTLRAAGMSSFTLYKYLIPATLLIGFFGFFLTDQIIPHSELTYYTWWNKTDPHPDQNGRAFWIQNGTRIIHVGYLSDGGKTLSDIDIYMRDPSTGILSQTIHAQNAHYLNTYHWQLQKTYRIQIKNSLFAYTPSQDKIYWSTHLTPDDFIRLSIQNPSFSTWTILKTLYGRFPSAFPPALLETSILERFFLPLFLCVLVLLTMPVIYIPPRTGFQSWIPIRCLSIGLLLIVTQGLLRALGNAEILPPIVATLSGLVIFILWALNTLLRNEI